MRAPRLHQVRREGASAVEMALLLPVVLLIFFAIVDFSRVFYLRASLTSAVADAVRLASLPATTDADVSSLILGALPESVRLGANGQITVNVDHAVKNNVNTVIVTANFPYSPLVLPRLIGQAFFSDTINASATAVMEP